MFCYVNVGRHIIAARQAPTITQANYRWSYLLNEWIAYRPMNE